MKVNEFVKRIKKLATDTKTIYMMGCFGQQVTEAVIKQKKKQYPTFYTSLRMPAIEAAINTGTYAFDCICMIKSVLWGFDEDSNATYGGAKYGSNGVPDISADQMIAVCKNVSTDFSKIEVGEYVWLKGHCGIYIGDGLVVECSPKWKNKVQITACANIGNKAGYNSRKWTKHGKLPYVDYGTKEATTTTKVENDIKPNDKVKIKAEATKYATGQLIPAWVKKRTYTIKDTDDAKGRVLLKEINSWVCTKDVEVV